MGIDASGGRETGKLTRPAWRHLQIWAEIFEARFEVPAVGNADTFLITSKPNTK
jgi:hypothetical protein